MANNKIGLKHANIIEILGIESLPEDQRIEILNRALEVVEAESLNRILESLSDEDKEKFLNLMEEESSEKVGNFFEEKDIDLLQIMEEETEKVKELLVKETRI